jgi:hypothetical protein
MSSFEIEEHLQALTTGRTTKAKGPTGQGAFCVGFSEGLPSWLLASGGLKLARAFPHTGLECECWLSARRIPRDRALKQLRAPTQGPLFCRPLS